MRRIRYVVAMSLDGYIADPQGESDWITMDPEIDFGAIFDQFDTILVGRSTFEVLQRSGRAVRPGMKTIVLSRTLQPVGYPGVTIVADNQQAALMALKSEPGKDIWLFGGGQLFRSLVEEGVVDAVEVAVIPILLGGGVPLLPPPSKQIGLELAAHRIYNTGIVSLQYRLRPPACP